MQLSNRSRTARSQDLNKLKENVYYVANITKVIIWELS